MSMFYIGARRWPGISKLIEECGEVAQVCGKLIALSGEAEHWDGSNLFDRIHDEIGDLLGAIRFVIAHCGLDGARIEKRAAEKLEKFRFWHVEHADQNPIDRSHVLSAIDKAKIAGVL